jgi:hypothetical protein
MKTILLAAAAVLSLNAARAADMPVFKAQQPFAGTGSGSYCGAGTTAGVAQASVSGNNLFATSLVNGNINAIGGSVGGDCGYISNRGPLGTWWQIEGAGKYQNITASDGPVSIASRWAATQELDFGAELFQMVFAAGGNVGLTFPSFTPSLPANVAVAALPRQYFGFKVEEFGISGNFFGAGGSTWAWAPGLTTGYRWQTLGAGGQPNGGSLKIFADVYWPQRGVTFNNVFGVSGPIVLGAAAKESTQYFLGVNYDFCLSC